MTLLFFVGWVERYLSQQDIRFAPSTEPLFVGWFERYLSQQDMGFASSTQPTNLLHRKETGFSRFSLD